jgi:hypothetical protein
VEAGAGGSAAGKRPVLVAGSGTGGAAGATATADGILGVIGVAGVAGPSPPSFFRTSFFAPTAAASNSPLVVGR